MDRAGGKKNGGAVRTAFCGLMLAFSMILSYIEAQIPFYFGVPGMKLGLPNLTVVLLLFLGSPGAALAVNALRIVLSGFMFGSMFGIMFSAAGAVVSFAAMYALKRTGLFGSMGVSVAGGVMHNIGQLLVAVFIVRTPGILYYAPALVLSGAVTGLLIGITAAAVIPKVRRIYQ